MKLFCKFPFYGTIMRRILLSVMSSENIREIETISLIPMAVFVSIIAFCLNYKNDMIPKRPYPLSESSSMKKDIFLAVFTFIAFVVVMYGLQVHAFFEHMSVKPPGWSDTSSVFSVSRYGACC